MDLRVEARSDRGRVRDLNEDSILASPPLIAVADGMGGHRAGEVASGMAIDVLTSWKPRLEGHSGRDAAGLLGEAFREAHRVVFAKGQEDESRAGMGTTLTAGWVSEGTLSLAHVGDSRAYLLRAGKLEQLTEDQNVAQEWVRRGRLSAEEAAVSPHRHVILQAIGAVDEALEVETTSVALRPGDRVLLATDGLFGMLKDPARLREILAGNADPADAARALIEAANAAGGEDNISAVVVDVLGEPGEPASDAQGSEPAPVVVERDRGVRAEARRRMPRQAWVIAGAVALLVVMALVFVLRPSTRVLVVTTRRGHVVVLSGHPGTSETDPATGKIVREYRHEPVREFPTAVQRSLRAGIPVDDLREASEVIERLPRVLGPEETPIPTPSGSPSGSASPEPPATPTSSP